LRACVATLSNDRHFASKFTSTSSIASECGGTGRRGSIIVPRVSARPWRITARSTPAYGAAGSLIVLLLWIYYSAQIYLLRAEFTRVFAYEHGPRSSQRRLRAAT
jgi:Virulence factor BrkB